MYLNVVERVQEPGEVVFSAVFWVKSCQEFCWFLCWCVVCQISSDDELTCHIVMLPFSKEAYLSWPLNTGDGYRLEGLGARCSQMQLTAGRQWQELRLSDLLTKMNLTVSLRTSQWLHLGPEAHPIPSEQSGRSGWRAEEGAAGLGRQPGFGALPPGPGCSTATFKISNRQPLLL